MNMGYVIMPKYDQNLANFLQNIQKGPNKVVKILDVTFQLLDILKVIHGAGLTYNDIKPENIMVSNDCKVTIIDFGFADTYFKDGNPVDSADTKLANFQGNILFSSQDQMNFFKTSPKDDIIAVFYMLIFLLSGNQFIGERSYMEQLKAALEEDTCNKKYFHYIRNYKTDFQLYEIANFLKYYIKLVPEETKKNLNQNDQNLAQKKSTQFFQIIEKFAITC